MNISVCIIAKNEEDCIEECLKSVISFADEIIVVDTGSTDQTKTIAKKYTDKIFDFEWIDDFASARNYSFDKATKEYVMWLDCDDIITEENQQKIMNLKKELHQDVVMLKYNVDFDENDQPIFSYYRERILKNNNSAHWVGRVHEVITPFGDVLYENIEIEHRKIKKTESQRNINIYKKMIDENIPFSVRDSYYYARELFYNNEYQECIFILEDFLNQDAWFNDKIEACKLLYNSYKIIGLEEDGAKFLFNSFLYDTPRSDVCCDIGDYFLTNSDYESAIFWFEYAHSQTLNTNGFILNDKNNFYPYLQLCVCYYKIGNIEKSILFNNKAGYIKPYNQSYLYNKTFFESLE